MNVEKSVSKPIFLKVSDAPFSKISLTCSTSVGISNPSIGYFTTSSASPPPAVASPPSALTSSTAFPSTAIAPVESESTPEAEESPNTEEGTDCTVSTPPSDDPSYSAAAASASFNSSLYSFYSS